jgi:hypothetical protein
MWGKLPDPRHRIPLFPMFAETLEIYEQSTINIRTRSEASDASMIASTELLAIHYSIDTSQAH